MDSAGLVRHSLDVLGIPWLTERETAALIVAVVGLLFFRAFRERYLLAWSVGWIAYAGFLFLHQNAQFQPTLFSIAASQADFVLAIALLAASALICTQSRHLLAELMAFSWMVLIFAAMRPFYFPYSIPAVRAIEISCRLIAAVAAFELVRCRLGRLGFGPFLYGAGLLTLNLTWPPFMNRIPVEGYMLSEALFGASMLLIVLDDSRARTRRLAVLNELAVTIARGESHAPMMQAALQKLNEAIGGKGAWFRVMEGENLVPKQHVGLSPEFLHAMAEVGMDTALANALSEKRATVVKGGQIAESLQEHLRQHGLHKVILVPVLGKRTVIGMLSFGGSKFRRHTREEMEFLETAAQKLGIAAENLRLSEQVQRVQRQWANTFDSIQDLILAHDNEFRILKINQALLLRLEKSAADLLGNNCEAVLPKSLNWTDCPYCERGSGLTEGMDSCFGGHSLVSTSSYAEQGGPQNGTIHVIHDTSERHAAEEKYRMLFEQAQEGMFVATLDGDLLDCNDSFVTMLGFSSRDELMALDLGSILGATAEERDHFRQELEAHNYVRNFELTVRRKDSSFLTVALSCFATRDLAGQIERYQGFVLDITEKKRSEDEMRRRNRELNALNAMAVIATQSFDLDEILNLTLRQVISLFGAETGSVYLEAETEGTYRRRAGWGPRSEARAKLSEVVFPDGFGDLVMRSRAEVITREFVPHLPPALVEFACADRLPYWIWVVLWSKNKPIGLMGIASNEDRHYSSNDENLLVAISRQLATTIEKVQLYEETCKAYEDLRRAQEQLLQSEKMSAVGQLISGVAHELNNPLTAILGYAQLLEEAGLDQRHSEYVHKLSKQAQRTHRVVQSLLSFARQRKPQKQQVDLRKVLEETISLREYDLKLNKITLEREMPAEPPIVIADPHQLEQVFLNVINNALDAIGETSGDGSLKIRVYRENEMLCVEFSDSGPGIKDVDRVFDPFYTTKADGKGTGLGLSICYGIIREHNGEIVARNREEGGAIIEVRLPASEKAVITEAEVSKAREDLVGERVLLVEEEDSVLEFERDVLVGAGANVTTAKSLDEIKERLLNDSHDAIVVSGQMQGNAALREIHSWVTANHAGMEKSLLFTFSNGIDPEDRAFIDKNSLASLCRPFEVADLIARVRALARNHSDRESGEGQKALSTSAGA